MKQLWRKYAAKIDALAPRERLIVFVAVIAVVVYAMFTLSVDLSQSRQKTLRAQLVKQRAEIAELQSQADALRRKQVDPDAANRARVDDLGRQVSGIENTLKDLQNNLVPAQRMNALLQEMLTADARPQLVSLRSLPVTLLLARPGTPPAAAGAAVPGVTTPRQSQRPDASEANVYKHGVEMTLQGSYADLHDYLARLEQSPWRMFWWRARLAADAHPRLTLTVTIYTLSLDKGWLEV